ncbi:kinase-like protein [Rozella allomycis CSF55]|uniref:non-specific serine/threonine protein kinase n=1 Tax=Rozella allomycis (strain CSF55) TaxID=988480 RepID=A0A4P9YE76_ROZAC|nr:kinase-like protein [Rozella allomycis CSF55]
MLSKNEDYSDSASIEINDDEDIIDEEELEEDYKPGGYHVANVGDVYKDGRYRLVRKLGWGHFSVVWLCWDLNEEKYYAMKIVKSARHYTETAKDEVKLLRAASNLDESAKGKDFIVNLSDDFMIDGPNGKHVCMVFEVLGENLLNLIKRYNYRGISIPILKNISYQILMGLDTLHRHCQIIHTDLKPENVLICLDDVAFNSIITESKSQNEPSHQMTARLKRNEIRNIRVKIADLGNACWVDKHFTNDIQTRQYRSPEVLIGAEYDTSTDMWSFACMFFELLTGDYLFDPHSHKNQFGKNDDHLAQMIELLGDIPTKFALSGKYSLDYFNKRGTLRKITKLKPWGLKNLLIEKYKFERPEAEELSSFLLPMLQFDPTKRASAKDMLQHPWIQNVNSE